jgi:hypothetical protein
MASDKLAAAQPITMPAKNAKTTMPELINYSCVVKISLMPIND